MISITTIGYGDMVPVTAAGRVVGMVVAFSGVLVLALPVAILGAGFVEEVERRRRGEPVEPSPVAPLASSIHLEEAQLEALAQRVAALLRSPPSP